MSPGLLQQSELSLLPHSLSVEWLEVICTANGLQRGLERNIGRNIGK